MRLSDRLTEADVIAHAQRHGLALDAALTVRPQVSALAPETPEGTLLTAVRKLAKQHGWHTYHTHDSRKSEEGWPDLVLCNGTDLLIYELKDNRREPSHNQELWLNLLTHTGKVEAGVWRPKMWPEIATRLTRKTHDT